MKICTACGKEFKETHFNQRCCSDDCKVEARKQSKKKYKASEKGKKSNKRWVLSEKRKENEKKYRQKPKSKKLAIARAKRYLQNHPELKKKRLEQFQEWTETEEGKESAKYAQKRYRKTAKGIQSRKNDKARRRQADKEGCVTAAEWNEKLAEFDNKCAFCRKNGFLEQDHIIPLSKGGKHEIKNIQPLCRNCNARKSNKLEGIPCTANIVRKTLIQ